MRRAGGVPRFVTLDAAALPADGGGAGRRLLAAHEGRAAQQSPQPLGHGLPRRRLALLAGFCERFDAVALCDEVWEHVVFDGRRHTPLMAFPGMRERTVKIGSAGKIFSLTAGRSAS